MQIQSLHNFIAVTKSYDFRSLFGVRSERSLFGLRTAKKCTKPYSALKCYQNAENAIWLSKDEETQQIIWASNGANNPKKQFRHPTTTKTTKLGVQRRTKHKNNNMASNAEQQSETTCFHPPNAPAEQTPNELKKHICFGQKVWFVCCYRFCAQMI